MIVPKIVSFFNALLISDFSRISVILIYNGAENIERKKGRFKQRVTEKIREKERDRGGIRIEGYKDLKSRDRRRIDKKRETDDLLKSVFKSFNGNNDRKRKCIR